MTRWNGQTLPTKRGGTIANGLYRLAYELAEKGSGTTRGDYVSAYLFRSGAFRTLGSLGSVGTFITTPQGKLVLSSTSNCSDQSGQATSASTHTGETDYLVDAQGQLVLFSAVTGSGGVQTIAQVFKPQPTLCGNLPKTVPPSPGDSLICGVRNCGCTEASNGPASLRTCEFVQGR